MATEEMNLEVDNRRVALLLSALGTDAVEPALSSINPARAQQIRESLKSFDDTNANTEEVDETLADFERFLRFALDAMGARSSLSTLADVQEKFAEEAAEEPEAPSKPKLKIFDPTDDPIFDLKRLQASQIAAALADEHPRTISMVLSKLSKERLAQTMDLLPEDLQTDIFLVLKEELVLPDDLVNGVIRATVERASKIEPVVVEVSDADQKMADLLRELPKATRVRIVDELKEKDAESAAKLQELLYRFEDIASYDNRSVQKILGQIETSGLIIALEDTSEEVKEHVLGNLSKRAADSLAEEMEFKQNSSVQEIEDAQLAIAKVIGQLDQEGELNLVQ